MAIKTYHDVFVEQLIRRERPGGEFLFKCGAVLLGLILITAAFVLARAFFPFFLPWWSSWSSSPSSTP